MTSERTLFLIHFSSPVSPIEIPFSNPILPAFPSVSPIKAVNPSFQIIFKDVLIKDTIRRRRLKFSNSSKDGRHEIYY